MKLFRRLTTLCSTIILPFIFSPAFAANDSYPSFTSAEHTYAGDEVKFFFGHDKIREANHVFNLPNGLRLTYGELIAFGDMYGTPNQAISQGKTSSEQKLRFLSAFNSFALNPNAVNEANTLVNIIREEQKIVDDGIKNGEKSETMYKRIANEMGRRFNCATGGSCNPTAWWLTPGRYLKLATVDYDHFATNAWLAYKIGHDSAIEQAILAGKNGDAKKLEFAYAMNGFACHFLSDSFAAGHIRTPRMELPEQVKPNLVGTLLVHYMHNEENFYGLHVHNLRGDRWIAYGDHSYLSQHNDQNRALLHEALQLSADEIYNAYLTGVRPDTEEVVNLFPIADETANNGNQDIAPLFYVDKVTHKVMRRQDVTNVNDRHWTSDWWGWSTLMLLIKANGELPSSIQARLALSEFGEQAMEDGFITDKNIISYIKKTLHT